MMNIQQQFAEGVKAIVSKDESVIGLAVAGSWLTNEVDEWSDLDLILVTKEKVCGNKETMLTYAAQFGDFLSGFTGEHVGEPRLLICLYDNPLLHVDIKFLILEEFAIGRVEMPFILHDTDGQLQQVLNSTTHQFPYPNYQWIEDRFWIWVHYTLLKIGRGEYFEALDALSFLRAVVLGPLLHISNGNLPRGVRKVERQLTKEQLQLLNLTVAKPERQSLLDALLGTVATYQALRISLFNSSVQLQHKTEEKVREFFEKLNQGLI